MVLFCPLIALNLLQIAGLGTEAPKYRSRQCTLISGLVYVLLAALFVNDSQLCLRICSGERGRWGGGREREREREREK